MEFLIVFYKQMQAQRLKKLCALRIISKKYSRNDPNLRQFLPRRPQPGWSELAQRTFRQSRVNRAYITRCQRGTGLVHDSNRTFEVRASPWTARRRDGLMSRYQGWQGATHIQNSPEVCQSSPRNEAR